jgi:glycosyltransferase involved in cell wall biosynthesis
MRIALVIHTLPRHSLGGSEICAAALAAEMARRHDVVVCAGRPVQASAAPRQEHGRGYRVEWLDPDPRRAPTFDAAYQNPLIDAQFDDVMARIRPDVVHIHGIWTLSNNLPLIARQHGARVVFTLHDFWLMCPRGQRLRPTDLSQCGEITAKRCTDCLKPWIAPRRWPSWRGVPALVARDVVRARVPMPALVAKARARLFRPAPSRNAAEQVAAYHEKTWEVVEAVDLFVAPSRFLADEFVRYGISRERIMLSDNGIDTAKLARCDYKRAPSVVRFGFAGSWMPSKGLHVLVDAFRGLTENARLIVFGSAPDGDSAVYTRDILARGADRRIKFAGRIEHDEVEEVFSAIDVLVVPSLWYENSPLTIKEAFASHTPVIASRTGGMAENVRDGVDGLLFTPGDPADLRAALRAMIHDPELIPRFSRQTPAVKTVAEHAIELETAFGRLIRREHSRVVLHHAHSASHP